MRQPLRYQIMVPMLGLMLSALVAVSVVNAYLSAGRAKQQIERQLVDITTTLDRSNFPFTDGVLKQMRGLSGAEFVLVADAGSVIASSTPFTQVRSLPRESAPDIVLGRRVTLDGVTYFHTARRLERLSTRSWLHILYPVAGYRELWTSAVYPPLAIGLASVILVIVAAVVVARRVSRPITGLRAQVERVAEGDFDPLPLPARNDEIRDLAQSVNRMAEMLSDYEREVRHTERLRTLAQLGGGIAHQMRNSATGCRMAIDLLAAERSLPDDCESLMVARRQLELMEKYLQRFLSMGKPPQATHRRPLDLVALIEELLPLVRPAARHASVDLQWRKPNDTITIEGDADGLEQLIVNLLLNAIEAASAGNADPRAQRIVRLVVEANGADRVQLVVEDSGPGPSDEVKEELFDPFVTGKADGVGLGLSVARQVAEQHGGRITWDHTAGATCFRVELPFAESTA